RVPRAQVGVGSRAPGSIDPDPLRSADGARAGRESVRVARLLRDACLDLEEQPARHAQRLEPRRHLRVRLSGQEERAARPAPPVRTSRKEKGAMPPAKVVINLATGLRTPSG